jgi:hypothetical protein
VVAGPGPGTIADDEAAPTLSVEDVRVETPLGAQARVVVRLAPVSSQTVTVGYATADGSAHEGVDYEPATGTLTLPPGAASASFDVAVRGDVPFCGGRDFTVALGDAANAEVGRERGTVTIAHPTAPSDFDRDGCSDILWRAVSGPDTGALFVWLMNGDGGATYLAPISTDWAVSAWPTSTETARPTSCGAT